MNTRIVSVEPDDSLQLVKEIFEHVRFHHLLVVENKRLVGIISDRDLLKELSPYLGTPAEIPRDTATLRRRAHQIMSRKPFTLDADASVQEAIALFNRQRISCLPVLDERGMPVGILSWRDIMRTLEQRLPADG